MGQHLTPEEKNTYRIGASVIDVTQPPELWKFTLEDVRGVLQHLRRYLGGSERSVWEHSKNVAVLVEARVLAKVQGDSYTRLCIGNMAFRRGLYHDASEAFTGDVPGPIKQHLGAGFRIFEDKIQEAVYKLAGCSTQEIVAKYGTEVHNAICEAVSWADAEDYRSEQQLKDPDYGGRPLQGFIELKDKIPVTPHLKEPMDDMFVQADQLKIETIEIEGKEYRGYWERISESDYDHLYPEETGPYPGPFGFTTSLWVKRLDGSPSSTFRFSADGVRECFKWVPEPEFDEGRSADSPPEGAASSTPKPELPEEEVEESRPYDVWDLLAHHDTLTAEAYELMQRKNNDYAGADGASPFKNFLHSETLGLCSVEQGMVVRLSDKLQRLAHAVSGQEMKVTDESVRDTILDIINYSVLISAYLKSKVQASS